ncbi:hypothetical protein EON80_31075 [bacterium]|nr:MAG: hypothetical protein EON80_31075 [bacterium]
MKRIKRALHALWLAFEGLAVLMTPSCIIMDWKPEWAFWAMVVPPIILLPFLFRFALVMVKEEVEAA